MSDTGMDVVRAVAVAGGALAQASVGFVLDRAERVAALTLSLALRRTQSASTMRAANAALDLLHRATPVAVRSAGQITTLSLFVGGLAVRAGARMVMFAAASTLRRLR